MPKINPKLLDKDWVYEHYCNRGMSCPQVGSILGVSASAVRRALVRLGIPRREHSQNTVGSGNPMYGKKHTEETRKKMSERYVSDTTKKKMSVAAINKFNHQPELRENLSSLAKRRTGVRNPFYGKQHSDQTKDKISTALEGKFRGEKGSNWQGGKTKLNFRIRQTGKYKRWQREVLQRDDFTCQICAKRGGPLHVDHIKPFSTIVLENKITSLEEADLCQELYTLDNGRTLCVPCHKSTDTYLYKMNKNSRQ